MDQNNQTKQPTVHRGGRKFRNDVILIGGILLLVCVAAGLLLLRGEGTTVRVEVDDRVVGVYPLSVDREIEIPSGENGEGRNLLVIRDGRAAVTEASCPDGICAAHRPISRVGESIVCLPNGVVITVVGEDENQPDIIA